MRIITAVAAAIVASGLAADPAAALSWCHDSKLDILLTNDDGYSAPGIQAMQAALIAAGHRVTMVAPLSNKSGSSAAITFAVVPVTNPEPGVYTVDGTPATTVLLGVSAIFPANNRPDLIVSGINNGANIGSATPISGTVGATIAGITQLQKPIPGIAISTDLVEGSDPTTPVNQAHFQEVAEFTARLVNKLIDNSCQKNVDLLPWHTALNVNYPPLAPHDVSGVVTAVQAQLPHFVVGFAPIGGGYYAPTFGAGETGKDPRADTNLFDNGYVTVVPIDGDYTASAAVQTTVKQMIEGLQP